MKTIQENPRKLLSALLIYQLSESPVKL